MKKHIPTNQGLSRLIKYFYKLLMPGTSILLLLVIPQTIIRPLFLGSRTIDLLSRVWLCFIFSLGYIILSDLNKYRIWFYSGKVINLSDHNDKVMGCWIIGSGVMGGFIAALVTSWAVQIFIPVISNYSWFIAIVNGLIYSMPIITKYNKNIF